MGIFDTLGNFASRIGRDALKGVGALGEFAGNIAGGAWSSFTDPGFNLPTTGGLGGKIGGLLGEAGERMFTPGAPMAGGTTSGQGGGIGEILSGESWPGTPPIWSPPPQVTPPRWAPQTQSIPFPMQTGKMMGVPSPYGGADPMLANVALPGGALIGQVLRNIPGVLGGAVLGYQAGGQQGQSLELPYGGLMFKQTMCGVRAQHLVRVQNPYTGKHSWFRNVGRPILFSGDLTACKRVKRVASRARRARGR